LTLGFSFAGFTVLPAQAFEQNPCQITPDFAFGSLTAYKKTRRVVKNVVTELFHRALNLKAWGIKAALCKSQGVRLGF
jgi:hypothetical protein